MALSGGFYGRLEPIWLTLGSDITVRRTAYAQKGSKDGTLTVPSPLRGLGFKGVGFIAKARRQL